MSPDNTDAERDSERDAWLREALRHAPDADVAAPGELSATILRQAREAAGASITSTSGAAMRPARAARMHPLMLLWSWLARPPVAAGFASVMVASLVGLMWAGRPMDEALPEFKPKASVGTAKEAAAEPTPSAITAVVLAEAPVPKASVSAAPAAAAPRFAEKERAAQRSAKKAPAVPVPRGEAATESAAATASPEPVAPPLKLAVAPPPAAVPDAVAPPLKAESSPAPVPAPAAARSPAPLGMSLAQGGYGGFMPRAETADAAPEKASEARRLRDDLKRLADSADPADRRQRQAPSVSVLSLEIKADPQRWTWQRGTEVEHPMTPALQAWLERLGRIEHVPYVEAMPPQTAPSLRFLRNGRLHTELTLGEKSFWLKLSEFPLSLREVPIEASTAAALKAALDEAAR